MVAARITAVRCDGVNAYTAACEVGSGSVSVSTNCPNLHAGDLVALDTKKEHICTLEDLRAQQAEFPHCIPDGIFILHEEGVKPGDDLKSVIGADDHVVEFEITPNRPDLADTPLLEISSTFIRQALAEGRDIRYFLHPPGKESRNPHGHDYRGSQNYRACDCKTAWNLSGRGSGCDRKGVRCHE